MHLPTHATLPQAPTSLTQFLTTPDAFPTPTGQDHPNPLSIFTPPTADTTNPQKSRRIVWQTPNVVMDDIPTTLVTVTTTAHATRWITLPLTPVSSAAATATAGLLTLDTTTATQHAAKTTAAELADVGEGVPDLPPLLIIFLLCWVVIAWVIALVLYLATFPERVGWSDGMLGRWRRGDHGKRRRHPTAKANDTESGEATTTCATGLGISFKQSPNTPRLRRPRSFDSSEIIELREPRPKHSDLAATAPLPSYGSFKALSPDASPTKGDTARESYQEDLETGQQGVRACESRLRGEQQPEIGSIAGVLDSVNALIDFVARLMVRMASDRVGDSAERGLLLPVKEEERESDGVVF